MTRSAHADPASLKSLDQVRRQEIQKQAHQAEAAIHSFDSAFRVAVDIGSNVTFSTHAKQRLQRRGISLTDDDLVRIHRAVDKAAFVGARSSLLLMGQVALVVSVTKRTVITAITRSALEENVFTNIDSAVFV